MKRAFNIIKFFYPVKFGTNRLGCWVRMNVSTYGIKIKVELRLCSQQWKNYSFGAEVP